MSNKYLDEVTKRAKEVSNGCPLMEGRTKGDAEEYIGKPLTIDDAFKLTGENGVYYCVTVKENPDIFFLSGGGLTAAVEQAEIVADKNGVLLSETVEGLKFKFEVKVKTKNKREFRPVTIL